MRVAKLILKSSSYFLLSQHFIDLHFETIGMQNSFLLKLFQKKVGSLQNNLYICLVNYALRENQNY